MARPRSNGTKSAGKPVRPAPSCPRKNLHRATEAAQPRGGLKPKASAQGRRAGRRRRPGRESPGPEAKGWCAKARRRGA